MQRPCFVLIYIYSTFVRICQILVGRSRFDKSFFSCKASDLMAYNNFLISILPHKPKKIPVNMMFAGIFVLRITHFDWKMSERIRASRLSQETSERVWRIAHRLRR